MFNHQSLPSPDALPRPHDPALLAVGLERWREAADQAADPALRDFAHAFADDPAGRAMLGAIFGNSPYLGHILVREQGFVRDFVNRGMDASLKGLLDGLRADCAPLTDTAALMKCLRVAKRRAALLIGLADITRTWPLMRVTGALSALAQTCLQLATAHVLKQAARGGKLTLPHPDDPQRGSGLIVLAMGKFGAGELNYSSDIDLIVLYDDGVVRCPEEEMTRTFVRLARELVRIMEERTADGYVFRTDLRLRPDPGATPLAVSVSAAEAYYGSLGQNWERAAMIKARPVAGDLEAGESFMKLIRHFVWRRSLDFAAIQDIHSIKRQIGSHKGHREKTVNGHNIKIGRGGIREIEFFAQTQQLIYGGRDPALRRPGTLAALEALVAAGRVERRVADELARAYDFLRTVEHRLQMVDDQQTHSLPKTDEGVAAIAGFMGFADPAAFREAVYDTLSRVEDHYARLFEEAPPLSGPGNLVFTGTDDDPETLETLRAMGFQNPSVVSAQVRAWHHGRYRATRSTRSRELLTELTPTLLESFGRTPHPDQAFLKFDEFLARLPAGVQLFSLFYANPALLALVAEVMGTAPRLADILSRRPAELDAVLTPGFFAGLPDRAALEAPFAKLLDSAQYFEDVLLLARRWTNEQRFRAGVHILRNITDADRCGGFLTDVAEIALAGLQGAVEAEFARRHGRFPGAGYAIVGMGRLGARSLSLRSDLDLITVYDIPQGAVMSDGDRPLSPNDYFIKLTQRLVSAITAPTAEGALYEVDMRLRPSGNAGPLAVSLEAFCRYQRDSAWTWEHMALCRARVITGPDTLRHRLEDTIRAVLTAPRDPDRLLLEVASMRSRIGAQHRADSVWDVKYVRGGMVDIQFITQYLTLRHAPARPAIVSPNTTEALARLADAGVLDRAVAEELCAAQRLWRRVQGFLRLTVEGRFKASDAPAALRPALARACFGDDAVGIDFDGLETRLLAIARMAHAHYQRIIEEPAAGLAQAQAAAAARNQEKGTA